MNKLNEKDLVIIAVAVSAYLESKTAVVEQPLLPKYKLMTAPTDRKAIWKWSSHPYFLAKTKLSRYVRESSSWSHSFRSP